MLLSVRRNVNVLIEAGPWIQAGPRIQAGGSDVIVLIEAGGFYSRKYGKLQNQKVLTVFYWPQYIFHFHSCKYKSVSNYSIVNVLNNSHTELYLPDEVGTCSIDWGSNTRVDLSKMSGFWTLLLYLGIGMDVKFSAATKSSPITTMTKHNVCCCVQFLVPNRHFSTKFS